MDGPRLPGAPEEEDGERVIAHVDVDCFYAACERLREPAPTEIAIQRRGGRDDSRSPLV